MHVNSRGFNARPDHSREVEVADEIGAHLEQVGELG